MTLQDWDDYAESSALRDVATTHLLCVHEEADRIFLGNLKPTLDTNMRKA